MSSKIQIKENLQSTVYSFADSCKASAMMEKKLLV